MRRVPSTEQPFQALIQHALRENEACAKSSHDRLHAPALPVVIRAKSLVIRFHGMQ